MIMNKVISVHFHKHRRYVPLRLLSGISDVEIQSSKNRLDYIGPPDPVSNLRPIIFAKSDGESILEEKYRKRRETLQNWNQEFWSKHNASFLAERKSFQAAQKQAGNSSLTADEMSVFYKQFLDKNWETHLNYNISWYKKNISLLLLEIRVKLSKLCQK